VRGAGSIDARQQAFRVDAPILEIDALDLEAS
jgi:hypothetical protein